MSRGFRQFERAGEDRFEQARLRGLAKLAGAQPQPAPAPPHAPPAASGRTWEQQVALDAESEQVAEGRIHVNTRPQRHE